jgi:hypothetical protein
MLVKQTVKLDDNTELEVYTIKSVDVDIAELNTKLNNRIEQVKRLETERDTARAEVTTLQTSLTEKDTLLTTKANVEVTNTTLARKLKAFELYADKIPPASLAQLTETSIFTTADMETADGLKTLDEKLKATFPVFFVPVDPNKVDPSKLAPAGGTGGNTSSQNIIVSKVEDLKGKSPAEINAGLNELKRKQQVS